MIQSIANNSIASHVASDQRYSVIIACYSVIGKCNLICCSS